MKKFLLSLFLLCSVFLGQAQRDLWFNEIYPDPGSNNSEYIELFNTSTTAIPLDCYVIVSYYNTGSQRGVYVYNFPTGTIINPFSHYVVASSKPVKYQKTQWDGTNLSSWNGTINGGYIQQYQLSSTGQWPTQGSAVPNNFKDFMYITTGNDASVNLLLYKINTDGTSTLVNSVFGNGNGTIPAAVTSLPALTVQSGSATCAPSATTPVTLTFSGITFNNTETFNIGSSTGNDNGYARYGDATCGGWDKFTGNTNTLFTPGSRNPAGGARTPILTSTTEKIVCGTNIQIQVISPTSSSSYPVEARLYIDVNKDGRLDDNDTYLESITINSGSATVYSFNHVYNASNNYLVVYRTSLGCFDGVRVPTPATGELTTKELNICGNQIDFSVSAATGDAAKYGLPMTVQLYENNGDVTFDPLIDVAIGNPVTVNSVSATPYSITIPEENKGKVYILVYTSANSCYSKVATPAPPGGELQPTQTYSCDKRLNFSIAATGDAINYSLPITVNVYEKNSDGSAGELLTSKLVTTLPTTNDFISLDVDDWGKNILVKYVPTNCLNEVVKIPEEISSVQIVIGGSYPSNSTKVTYFISNAAPEAYPLQLSFYEDPEKDGLALEQKPLITRLINSPQENGSYEDNVSNPKYNAIVTATPTVGCSAVTRVFESIAPLPVKLVSFNAKRNKEKVLLTWETAMEQNNSGFDIQRKTGNGEWKTVAFMFSKANGGNSQSVLTYEYADINPAKGTSQYRLRQVDIDTRYTFSEIRSVRGLEQASNLLVYPNPSVDGTVNMVFDEQSGNRTIVVSDISGRIVKQYRNITDSSFQINNLQNGIYSIEITNTSTGDKTVEKVIIKKR